MTRQTTSFVYVTFIASTPEKVFEAITRPDITRRYWGHDNVSDWQPGSKGEHIRANDDRTVNIAGEVIESSPPSRLVVSWANASEIADPEAYSQVTFEIEPYEDMVKLTVSHDDLVVGSGMAAGVSKGWPLVLSSLKSLLETGQGLDVFARPRAA